MFKIVTLTAICAAFMFEAMAHYFVIKGLTKCGQNQRDNDAWHTYFFCMWTAIALSYLFIDWTLYPVLVYMAATRLLVFAALLNWLRGKPIYYLSDNHLDGLIKRLLTIRYKKLQVDGEKLALVVRVLFWLGSIYLALYL